MSKETKKLKDHIRDVYRDVNPSPETLKRLKQMTEQKLEEAAADPTPAPTKPTRRAIFGLAQVAAVLAIVSILSLIAIPNFISLRARAYGASAKSAGRNAVLSIEVLHNQGRIPGELVGQPAKINGEPAKPDGTVDVLEMLLSYDKNLTDDTDVTFTFLSLNTSGYSFQTSHANEEKLYEFKGSLHRQIPE